MYNNEIDKSGNQVGFWLINNNDVKQPLYFTFQKLYTNGKKYVVDFNQQHGRYPNAEEYSAWAVSFLESLWGGIKQGLTLQTLLWIFQIYSFVSCFFNAEKQ